MPHGVPNYDPAGFRKQYLNLRTGAMPDYSSSVQGDGTDYQAPIAPVGRLGAGSRAVGRISPPTYLGGETPTVPNSPRSPIQSAVMSEAPSMHSYGIASAAPAVAEANRLTALPGIQPDDPSTLNPDGSRKARASGVGKTMTPTMARMIWDAQVKSNPNRMLNDHKRDFIEHMSRTYGIDPGEADAYADQFMQRPTPQAPAAPQGPTSTRLFPGVDAVNNPDDKSGVYDTPTGRFVLGPDGRRVGERLAPPAPEAPALPPGPPDLEPPVPGGGKFLGRISGPNAEYDYVPDTPIFKQGDADRLNAARTGRISGLRQRASELDADQATARERLNYTPPLVQAAEIRAKADEAVAGTKAGATTQAAQTRADAANQQTQTRAGATTQSAQTRAGATTQAAQTHANATTQAAGINADAKRAAATQPGRAGSTQPSPTAQAQEEGRNAREASREGSAEYQAKHTAWSKRVDTIYTQLQADPKFAANNDWYGEKRQRDLYEKAKYGAGDEPKPAAKPTVRPSEPPPTPAASTSPRAGGSPKPSPEGTIIVSDDGKTRKKKVGTEWVTIQ